MKLRSHCAFICLTLSCLLGCTSQSVRIDETKWYSHEELIYLQNHHDNLQEIQHLRLTNVHADVDLSQLSGLQELYISNSDWSKIHNIPNGLTVLDIENVKSFTFESNHFRNLKKIAVHDCANFALIPSDTVTDLFIDVCQDVTLPDIPNNLQALRIVDTSFSQMTSFSLERLTQLKTLILHGGSNFLISGDLPQNLVELSILNNAIRYHTFDISKIEHLQTVAITNVENIILGNNSELKEIQIFDSKNVHISGLLPQSLECIEVRDTAFREGEVLRVSKDTEVSLDGCKNVKVERTH